MAIEVKQKFDSEIGYSRYRVSKSYFARYLSVGNKYYYSLHKFLIVSTWVNHVCKCNGA